MSVEVDRCPTCGAENRKYWHSLTPGLVEGLMKFGRAVQAKGHNTVHLRHDMDGHSFELTRDQWSNFTKPLTGVTVFSHQAMETEFCKDTPLVTR